jgi:hypothetical protein
MVVLSLQLFTPADTVTKDWYGMDIGDAIPATTRRSVFIGIRLLKGSATPGSEHFIAFPSYILRGPLSALPESCVNYFESQYQIITAPIEHVFQYATNTIWSSSAN